MPGRRVLYLALLAGCVAFFLFYRQWVSWVLLIWLLCLPLLSLLISLPGMLRVRFAFTCPERVQQRESVTPRLQMDCPFPPPLMKCQIQVVHLMSGERFLYEQDEALQTTHCGARQINIWRLWVYDYMGLFRRRVRNVPSCYLTVEPIPMPLAEVPWPEESSTGVFQPKRSGSFGENHELRPYRPGDDLRQIHWKLVAKTGQLILREPLEPVQDKLAVTLILSGHPVTVDRKLGELLWTAEYLLSRGYRFEICCRSGKGLERYPVADALSLRQALQGILASPLAGQDAKLPSIKDAKWLFHIGGGLGEG